MLILVRPNYPAFLQDNLFRAEHRFADHWLTPAVVLRQHAAKAGIEIHTWDMRPLEDADVILFQDLPSKDEVLAARRANPRAKLILQIQESPLGRGYVFLRENHTYFHRVLTYHPDLRSDSRYVECPLPASPPATPPADIPFEERRPCVLINSNHNLALNGAFSPWHGDKWSGMPALGCFFSGWKVPLRVWLKHSRGELYSRRRRLARLAENSAYHDLLDVYGYGWSGEPIIWPHRFLRHRPFSRSKGCFFGQKMEVLPHYRFCLAFENYRGSSGYISEKLFDVLFAGVVPIYLGEERLSDQVPAECWVDARRLGAGSDVDIFRFIANCGKREWEELRAAGAAFVKSDKMRRFSADAFARTVLGACCSEVKRSRES